MVVCPSCGQENPEGFRFCGACATPLTEQRAGREERKVVSVLFCDLVGSTARAERLDPEDVRALLSRYHARVRQELERFGGTVEKFIGDAVVALAILAGELGRAADLLEVGGDKTLAANSRLEAARRGALDQLEPALAFFRSVGASRYVLEGEALRSSASARMQTSTTTGSN